MMFLNLRMKEAKNLARHGHLIAQGVGRELHGPVVDR